MLVSRTKVVDSVRRFPASVSIFMKQNFIVAGGRAQPVKRDFKLLEELAQALVESSARRVPLLTKDGFLTAIRSGRPAKLLIQKYILPAAFQGQSSTLSHAVIRHNNCHHKNPEAPIFNCRDVWHCRRLV